VRVFFLQAIDDGKDNFRKDKGSDCDYDKEHQSAPNHWTSLFKKGISQQLKNKYEQGWSKYGDYLKNLETLFPVWEKKGFA